MALVVGSKPLPDIVSLGWEPYIGATRTLVKMTVLGRKPVKVQRFWVPAVQALEEVAIATGYENPTDYIGSYNLRNIAGTLWISWHATGGALDIDYGGDNPDSPDHPLYDRNPHIHRPIVPGDSGFGVEWQILEHQVRAIEAIRTCNGRKVWTWLGWYNGDTMHFQPACSPSDIVTGIDRTTIQGDIEMAMTTETWTATLREEDIVRMGEVGIINPAGHPKAEVPYYLGLLSRVNDKSDPLDYAASSAEWQNLRNAVDVRSPLWV